LRRRPGRPDRKAARHCPGEGLGRCRRYERHWTPVHIDFHVDDFEIALAKVLDAGATCEQRFEGGARPAIAFCSDPFGNGFCIVGPRAGS
jgi:predicted enzyme related to lactoylglutathione lyase